MGRLNDAKQIRTYVEGKTTCGRHGKTQKTDSDKCLTSRDKEMSTPAVQQKFKGTVA